MQSLFPCHSSHSADAGQIDSHDCTATYVRNRLLAAGLTVLVMLLMKRHYSAATVTQLDWILAPTAKLVAWFTSAKPALESNTGYVDFAAGIIVAPACAGVNFMIMAFGLAAFYGLHYVRRLPGQLVWLILALAAAYYLTLIVNTVRIALSMALYDANIYSGPVTAARVHRVAGVALYLGALWLYFFGLRPLIAFYSRSSHNRKRNDTVNSWGWMVLVWYFLGAVGVPLANGAGRQNLALFIEHCSTVLLAGLAFWVLGFAIKRVFTFQVQRHR